MKSYHCSFVTTYNYWFNLTVIAPSEFAARRIAQRWAQIDANAYWVECLHRIYVDVN